MAGSFTSTGTYSNLTRKELEQLRRADFAAGGKALTIGDSGLSPEGILGPGDVNAEPYLSLPTVFLSDIGSVTPPNSPAGALSRLTEIYPSVSQSVQWVGPNEIFSSTAGYAIDATHWKDPAGVFISAGVAANDLLIVNLRDASTSNNSYVVATITAVTTDTLTLTNIRKSTGAPGVLDVSPETYDYTIIRPNAVQLFAVPGSGPLGREQSFLMVKPGSTLHSNAAPSKAQIEADRLKNVVPGLYSTADRADAIYGGPNTAGPGQKTLDVGYRVILYKSNAAGTGPDLMAPIATLNPVIDSTVPAADQRMTFDFHAGVVRFSCAPRAGDDIKRATGGVDPTTGRLSLFAVFWIADSSYSKNSAAGLFSVRANAESPRPPGWVVFHPYENKWLIGTNTDVANNFFIVSRDTMEDPVGGVMFGQDDPDWPGSADTAGRYLRYTTQGGWKFVQNGPANNTDPIASMELSIADRTALTMGDGSTPAKSPGANANPQGSFPAGAATGMKNATDDLIALLQEAAVGGYGVVHLRKGRYYTNRPIVVPPGVIVEGEGSATRVFAKNSGPDGEAEIPQIGSVFRFGPNTPWGVWDASYNSMGGTLDFEMPTLTTKVQGFDLVWNPVRRTWGVAMAVGDAIYFNEVRADGTRVYPNLGIDIKNSAKALFKSNSPGAKDHTNGHYPRIAYSESLDQYWIVWVEVNAGGTGPVVMLQGVQTNTLVGSFTSSGTDAVINDSVSDFATLGVTPGAVLEVLNGDLRGNTYTVRSVDGGGKLTLLTGIPATSTASYRITFQTIVLGQLPSPSPMMILDQSPWDKCSNHPSIAISTQTDKSFTPTQLAISFWSYDPTNFAQNSAWATHVYEVDAGSVATLTRDRVSGTHLVVSSTDVAHDEQGTGFLFASSIRYHSLYTGTQGSIASGTFQFTDSAYSGATPWTDRGVDVGSRFLHLGGTDSSSNWGQDGRVQIVSGSTLGVFKDTNGNYAASGASKFSWAVAPISYVLTRRFHLGSFITTTNVTENAPTSDYVIEMREPDFVRVSSGDTNWLLVFQSFNTTSFLSQQSMKNFDNGKDTSFVDAGGHTMRASTPYREHIATCAMLLNDRGENIGLKSRTIQVGATDDMAKRARDIEISSRSLGARPPIVMRPNAGTSFTRRNHDREVSALNFFHKWDIASNTKPSLIPDVTWSGTDWTIVSPSKGEIRSELGTFRKVGSTYYFSDPTFYFGDGINESHDGIALRATLDSNDAIHIPSINTFVRIVRVYDEHTVQIDSDLSGSGIPSGTTNIEWVLVGDPANNAGRIKNPGFRVSADGRLILSTSYTTFAEDPGASGVKMDTPESPLMYRKNAEALNEGSLTSDFAADVNNRLRANIYYNGVAVGRPRGFSEAYKGLNESPYVAVAWGENMYGFLDRIFEGTALSSSTSSTVSFFRQSFGPYRNGIRSMHVTGATVSQGLITQLRVQTAHHVFTRHGAPVTFTGGFATDGYRNCFVYPVLYSYDGYFAPATKMALAATYTDAIGRHKIKIHAAEHQDLRTSTANGNAASISGYVSGTQAQTVSGLVGMKPEYVGQMLTLSNTTTSGNSGTYPIISYTSPTTVVIRNATGTATDAKNGLIIWTVSPTPQNLNPEFTGDLGPNPAGDALDYMAKSPAHPSSPVVLWDGSRFVAAYTAINNTGTRPATGLVCLTTLPGGEDAYSQGRELTGDSKVVGRVMEFARISCGDRIGSTLGLSQLYACDMAYSGKVYAVVWVAGLNPSTYESLGDKFGGSAIGIALFNATGELSGAQSFLIDATDGGVVSDANRAAYTNPKITWDGKQFVVMWRRHQDTLRHMEYVIVPESGFGSSLQVKRFAAQGVSTDQSPEGLGLGVIDSFGNYITVDPSHQVACQPGDILVINKVRLGATDDYKDNGWYMVEDYDPLNRRISLHQRGALQNPGATVYGAILTGGAMGDPTNLPNASGTISAAISGFNHRPKRLNSPTWGEGSNFDFGSKVLRLCSLTYNDITDEYGVLYVGSNSAGGNALMFSAWQRGTFQLRQEVKIAAISQQGVAQMAWNGHHYLVVRVDESNGSIIYYMLSRDGAIIETSSITYGPGGYPAIGSAEGQAPGSGFGDLSSANVRPYPRRLTIQWNNRLNRWVVSAGYLWYDATVGAPYSTEATQITWFASPRKDGTPLSAISSWTGRTIVLNAADGSGKTNFQPGLRISNTSPTYATPMIVSFDDDRTLVLDTDVTEIDSWAVSEITAGNMIILPREDVFCWTIGFGSPAIQIADADDVFLENVEIGGSIADIEEFYSHMARPIWKSGGPPVGAVAAASGQRSSQYSHTFLTPANKVDTVRLTNVRSRAGAKYGYGFNPGSPSFDRATFGDRNRKG